MKRIIGRKDKAEAKQMRSSKSRSRSKSNRNRPSSGNVVNRVFDSSGPEGKVRGTPQQVIEKYNQLARDAQLSGDRVATENFQQHAEHYTRLLSEAQREQDARREEQERQNRERQAERDRDRVERQDRDTSNNSNTTRDDDPAHTPQPDVIDVVETSAGDQDSGLVETPESTVAKPAPRRRTRSPAKPKPKPKPAAVDAAQDAAPVEAGDDSATPEAAAE